MAAVGLPDREQVAQVGRRHAHVVAEGRNGALQLCRRDLLTVTLVDPDPALEQVDERMKRRRPAEGQAMPFPPVGVARAGPELVEKARLADARLANDEDDLPVAAPRAGEGSLQRVELPLAADERGQPALGAGIQARPPLAGGFDDPGPDRLGLAAHRQLTDGSSVEVVGDETVGGLPDHDLARLRRLLKARGNVGRVADSRVVHPEVVSDAADDDEPAVEALAHLEGQRALARQLVSVVLERALDAERGAHRSLRVVLVGERRAEERHDAVPEELVHRSLVPMDLGQHELEGARHEAVHVLGVEPRRERGEARDVHEQDGDLLAFALEGGLRGEDALGEVPGV